MKKIILILTCALVSPWALAQTSTTTTVTDGETSTIANGLVTTLTLDGKITVKKDNEPDAVEYDVTATARCKDKKGKEIEASKIKPGTRVQAVYDESGNLIVMVDQD